MLAARGIEHHLTNLGGSSMGLYVRDKGRVADYIPQLAKVPAEKFGIAVVPIDGPVVTAGDADEPFSIQSISKVFTLTLALGEVGDRVWERVGREPSGNAFNSIVQLEHERGKPRNPFVNAETFQTNRDPSAEGDKGLLETEEQITEVAAYVSAVAGAS